MVALATKLSVESMRVHVGSGSSVGSSNAMQMPVRGSMLIDDDAAERVVDDGASAPEPLVDVEENGRDDHGLTRSRAANRSVRVPNVVPTRRSSYVTCSAVVDFRERPT
jgi:hypothetical protein